MDYFNIVRIIVIMTILTLLKTCQGQKAIFCRVCVCSRGSDYIKCRRGLPILTKILTVVRNQNLTLIVESSYDFYYAYKHNIDPLFVNVVVRGDRKDRFTSTTRPIKPVVLDDNIPLTFASGSSHAQTSVFNGQGRTSPTSGLATSSLVPPSPMIRYVTEEATEEDIILRTTKQLKSTQNVFFENSFRPKNVKTTNHRPDVTKPTGSGVRTTERGQLNDAFTRSTHPDVMSTNISILRYLVTTKQNMPDLSRPVQSLSGEGMLDSHNTHTALLFEFVGSVITIVLLLISMCMGITIYKIYQSCNRSRASSHTLRWPNSPMYRGPVLGRAGSYEMRDL